MATPNASASASAAGATAAAEATEGPVLSVVSKRLRQLQEKQERIRQIESLAAAGEELNQEQKELLASKSVVDGLIHELKTLHPRLASALAVEHSIRDLLELLYFGSLSNVQRHSDFDPKHERSCCISHQDISDDAAGLLLDSDLDSICTLSSLVVTGGAAVSPREALEACGHHARLWLYRANESIGTGSSITYAEVRSKLDIIMASSYYTANPSTRMGESPPVAKSPGAVEGQQEILTHGVIIQDLPHNILPSQLAREFHGFGNVKLNSIRVKNNGNLCCAYLEFEHISGLQRAIESSHIVVHGHDSYVQEATIDYWETYGEMKETNTKMVTPGKKKHLKALKKEKHLCERGQANGGGRPASSLQQVQHTPPPSRTLNSQLPLQMLTPAWRPHCRSFGPSSNPRQTSTSADWVSQRQSFGAFNLPQMSAPAAQGSRRWSFGPS